jgi:hypothetical protein
MPYARASISSLSAQRTRKLSPSLAERATYWQPVSIFHFFRGAPQLAEHAKHSESTMSRASLDQDGSIWIPVFPSISSTLMIF